MIEDWESVLDPETNEYRVQTRDGCPVAIHTLNSNKPEYPVLGEIFTDNNWSACYWDMRGWYVGDHCSHIKDLVPAPRKVKRWIVVWRYMGDTRLREWSSLGQAKEDANFLRRNDAQVLFNGYPVEWEE